jgi:hypothetical protein
MKDKDLGASIKRIEGALSDIEKEVEFLRWSVKEMYIKNRDLKDKLDAQRK